VSIEEIDVIGPQTLQAGVCHKFDMLGAAIGSCTAFASFKIYFEAELCSNHNLVADGLERLAHQFFIGERAIGFGGIEHGHATVMGVTNQFDHLALVGCRAIARAHAHAAEAKS
jgi:hypothetical protein